MPDIVMSVTISRTLLGLGALELNDHLNYYAAPSSPGPVTWEKQTVSARHVDGDFAVAQRRGNVEEECLFEVLGDTQAALHANIAALINAFKQMSYTLTTTMDGVSYQWACGSANYQVVWSGPRIYSKQLIVRLSVPRSPVPLVGSF